MRGNVDNERGALDRRCGITYGCYIDGLEGSAGCVADSPEYSLDDCELAGPLYAAGKTKWDCDYWKPVIERQFYQHTCPSCGHQYDTE